MSKNLLIIESPNKIETITKYLKGDDFKIMATIGHIRDLSTRGMGFDEKTLEPKWIIPTGKKKGIRNEKTKQQIINEIKAAANKAEKIYLATDPDREGEAIAWHVYEVLSDKDKAKCFRITFNEITKPAILKALEQPRKIDIRWVESQFARRILDRLVGYRLSKLVRDKMRGTSAGRVQTVALKFIYDREKEIERFKQSKWWTVDAVLENNAKLILRELSTSLKEKVNLFKGEDSEGSGIDFADEPSAKLVVDTLGKEFKIYAIDDPTQKNSNPREPYKTSTLQQDAINKLGWNVGKVTMVAQHLYEGIRVKGEHTALISYPRTDSVRISTSFSDLAKEFILKKYGEKYYQMRYFANKKKNDDNVQDAHEAIRVIDPFTTPESLKSIITREEYSLYKLIWIRTIAAYMTPARYETTIVRLQNKDCKFYTYNRRLIFDGYRSIYQHYEDNEKEYDIQIAKLKVGHIQKMLSIEAKEHTSMPPPRFNQASLIKALDEAGVGRPSTYRSMANMAVERGYAKLESRAYMMLPIGNTVVEGLNQYFPEILDKEFTKKMEEHLDDIANHDEKWKEWIRDDFKPKFDKELVTAQDEMKKAEPEEVGRPCPVCGKPLIYRRSKRTGVQFIGCSGFPACKYAEFPNSPKRVILDEKCPLCGKNLVERTNKRGQPFVGCSGFPKCRYIKKVDKDGKVIEFKNIGNSFKKRTGKIKKSSRKEISTNKKKTKS
ncbi:MAG: type I DNA topoisomerase [Mycoplasmataceae bacterium]|nr:type I DNA topoisomerase [Mycoplasmataceae bacterium]